ncbi:hypothetical protein EVAR_83281_1 [Eumeta japonica]|uniref:Uncharacterized protein n=1 Tax=Eumeta variegata TaxID=151549 RepID=A0A4C1X9J5_EUMVA|nr:hypothetical protein EVAR_83281_1 [Eumeta japonica]
MSLVSTHDIDIYVGRWFSGNARARNVSSSNEDGDAIEFLGLIMCKTKKARIVWCKDRFLKRKLFPRTDLLNELKFSPKDWHYRLRMNEEAQLALISPVIKKRDTVMRETISPMKNYLLQVVNCDQAEAVVELSLMIWLRIHRGLEHVVESCVDSRTSSINIFFPGLADGDSGLVYLVHCQNGSRLVYRVRGSCVSRLLAVNAVRTVCGWCISLAVRMVRGLGCPGRYQNSPGLVTCTLSELFWIGVFRSLSKRFAIGVSFAIRIVGIGIEFDRHDINFASGTPVMLDAVIAGRERPSKLAERRMCRRDMNDDLSKRAGCARVGRCNLFCSRSDWSVERRGEGRAACAGGPTAADRRRPPR